MHFKVALSRKIKAKLGDSEGYMEQILDTVEAKIGVE